MSVLRRTCQLVDQLQVEADLIQCPVDGPRTPLNIERNFAIRVAVKLQFQDPSFERVKAAEQVRNNVRRPRVCGRVGLARGRLPEIGRAVLGRLRLMNLPEDVPLFTFQPRNLALERAHCDRAEQAPEAALILKLIRRFAMPFKKGEKSGLNNVLCCKPVLKPRIDARPDVPNQRSGKPLNELAFSARHSEAEAAEQLSRFRPRKI